MRTGDANENDFRKEGRVGKIWVWVGSGSGRKGGGDGGRGAQVADLPELPSTERRLASIGLKEILAGET